MGAKLRNIRLGTGLTQDELAKRMGYFSIGKRMALRRLETGRIRKPTLEMVARYLQGCGARWHCITDLLESVPPVKLEILKVKSRKSSEAVKRLRSMMPDYLLTGCCSGAPPRLGQCVPPGLPSRRA